MAKHRREAPRSSLSEWIASLRKQPDQEPEPDQEQDSDLSMLIPYAEWPDDINILGRCE